MKRGIRGFAIAIVATFFLLVAFALATGLSQLLTGDSADEEFRAVASIIVVILVSFFALRGFGKKVETAAAAKFPVPAVTVRSLRGIAKRRGLKLSKRGGQLSGETLGLSVSGHLVEHARILVEGLVPDLSIVPDPGGLFSRPAEDLLTGDDTFDRKFHIRGDPIAGRALFTTEARRLITEAFEEMPGTLAIGDGGLEWVSPQPMEDPEAFARTLDRLIRIGGALRPTRTADDLYAVAGVDADPGVRRFLLQFLTSEFPDDARTTELLREARHDSDPIVRELALSAKGEAGQLSIAEGVEGNVSLAGDAGAVTLAEEKKMRAPGTPQKAE